MSAHDTTSGHFFSSSALISSMRSKPLRSTFGPASFSEAWLDSGSINTDASQPFVEDEAEEGGGDVGVLLEPARHGVGDHLLGIGARLGVEIFSQLRGGQRRDRREEEDQEDQAGVHRVRAHTAASAGNAQRGERGSFLYD
ncbi:hypothetical protein U9M48_006155 [Paspalum notatum var. saurae]|uniref:Uncharacterized protein n=1 Tax=Paspalum notatum var. saurae TaxID=547442 RepID=A0AAQ3PY58_PASNO